MIKNSVQRDINQQILMISYSLLNFCDVQVRPNQEGVGEKAHILLLALPIVEQIALLAYAEEFQIRMKSRY